MKKSACILVVEDEENVRVCVCRTLEAAGFQTLAACNGVEALDLLGTSSVELILTDIAMPRMNGYQLHAQVSQDPRWVSIPFIYLTARVLDSDVRYGKEMGVDDYLTKPFRREDLLAAVRGRLRRAQQLSRARDGSLGRGLPRSDVLSLGSLRVDLGQHRVWLNGKRTALSSREFKLLAYLASQADRVIPLQDLVHVTHDLETDRVEAGTLLRPLIRSIRRKLGYAAGQMGCIENVRGVGYQLVPPASG
jgi:DNA-binding response OmpR family regulator